MQNNIPESHRVCRAADYATQVHRAQQGDCVAFDCVVKYYRPLLFSIAFLRTANADAAEDMVQDTLAEAWRHLPTLKDSHAFPAWIRAIIVHACNHWYHKERRLHDSTRSWEDVGYLVTDATMTPLAQLLGRERQRTLHEALLTLPEANRLALLLHAWGGYSYAEIADLVAVRPSTIEGRIYRARRQLRVQLQEPGASSFLKSQSIEKHPIVNWNDLAKDKKNMTLLIPTESQPNPHELALNCVLFNERFSRLIDAGVSLKQALQVLEEMPQPYGSAIRDLHERIVAGDILSGPMKSYPALFSTFYVGLVRAGEVGGNLEETLQRARRVTTREWELARRRPANEITVYLTLPSPLPLPEDWAELTDYQRLVTQILFCNALSMLLASGVPILAAMDIVGELLPKAQRTLMEQARVAIKATIPVPQALELIGIFPAFILSFLEVGYVSGTLDSTLYLAAETIEQELNCRFAVRG